MDVLHKLVQVVARSFYDDKAIVILDTLVREVMVPDDVIIDRMQIIIRDFNRVVAKLQQDRLVKCEARQQPRADEKLITRNYLYIDYKQFVDVVKFRIFKMRQSVEDMIKREMESKGYICPSCKTVFGSLDVSRLLNARSGLFQCDVCPDVELQAYDSCQIKKDGPHELHSRLMEQTRQIVSLLKQADEVVIPAFLPGKWLETHGAKYSLVLVTDEAEAGPQLAVAGANSQEPVRQASVTVEIADEATINANAAPTSTPLPDWHMFSTVTGEAIRADKSGGRAQTATIDDIRHAPLAAVEGDTAADIAKYYSSINNDDETAHTEERPAKLAKIAQEAPFVSVAGVQVPFDRITDEDKDRMTEEEYTHYYEVYMSQTQ